MQVASDVGYIQITIIHVTLCRFTSMRSDFFLMDTKGTCLFHEYVVVIVLYNLNIIIKSTIFINHR